MKSVMSRTWRPVDDATEAMMRTARFVKGLVVERRPKNLAVESTGACNLNCPFCRYGQSPIFTGKTAHSDIERQLGTMDLQLFKERVVPSALEFGTRMMQLHFQGEPLLNKRLVEMIRVGKEAGLWMQFFTNGLLMTEKTMDGLLDSRVDLVRFSIDGNSPGTYKVNRVGGDFDKVISILGTFADKARQRQSSMKIQWSFIIMRNNEHEVEAAARRAQELGVEFIAKVVNTTDPALRPVDPRAHRTFKPKPCQQIYGMANILWNGDVVPCCYDVEAHHVLGNIKEQTLLEIWNGPRYVEFRRRTDRARQNPENEPELCRTCPMWR